MVQVFVAHPLADRVAILEEELRVVDDVFCAGDKAGIKDAQGRNVGHG